VTATGPDAGRSAASPADDCPRQMAKRSPLAQLLHALNQPLTGLQCCMEVALASPRSDAQYVQGLREGLKLTERMRALVGAIMEVADMKEEINEKLETIDLKPLLRDTADDLRCVAEAKGVRIVLHFSSAFSLRVRAGRRRLVSAVFRLLESTLNLAAPGSAMRVEAAAASTEICIHIHRYAGEPVPVVSRSELGLLIAQAAWEQTGGQWDRTLVNVLETITIRLPDFASSGNL
jgi:signal transduction histidine kinase